MFEVNPLANPDALWQYAVMLNGAAIIGYLIGYISLQNSITLLENKLNLLQQKLSDCYERKAAVLSSYPSVKQTNLIVIEGIDSKIETILKNAGINSLSTLSQSTPDQISAILIAANPHYQAHDPSTWPVQAKLVCEQKWQELKACQNTLKGGRQA